MELLFSVIAIALSIFALGITYFTFWLDWLKPFRLKCVIRGVLWYPSAGGRTDTPFSIILPLVIENTGAKPGIVQAAFIRLFKSSPSQEFRLDAMVTVDVNLTVQLASAADEAQKAQALRGIGGFIQLGRYEVKELGIHFTFPPINAKRYQMFTQPSQIAPGDYQLELWFCVGDRWACYAKDPVVTFRKEILQFIEAGTPVINLSGAIYDTAPGAPLGPSLP